MFIEHPIGLHIKETKSQMKPRKWIILLIPLLGVVAAAIILNKSWLIGNLIDPMTRLLWFIIRLVKAFDQEAIWNLLILIVMIVWLLIIPRPHKKRIRSSYMDLYPSEDRLATWEAKFRSADRDRTERAALQKELRDLDEDVFDLAGPDEATRPTLPQVSTNPFQRIARTFGHWIARFENPNDKFQDKTLQRSIDQLLTTMESEMENHDDRSPSSD